jgi:hypothetical protein
VTWARHRGIPRGHGILWPDAPTLSVFLYAESDAEVARPVVIAQKQREVAPAAAGAASGLAAFMLGREALQIEE